MSDSVRAVSVSASAVSLELDQDVAVDMDMLDGEWSGNWFRYGRSLERWVGSNADG